MAIKRFSGSFKTRTDVFDNITPNNVVQPNVSVPAGEWKPAAWLPIVWTGEASKDSFVISSGKVVCFDRQGRIAPAGYKKIVEAAGLTDVVLTYTSADVAAGVINLATGVTCTATTVTLQALVQGLLDRGLVMESDVADSEYAGTKFAIGTVADVRLVASAFFSEPVGVCTYDVYVWAGDTPGTLNKVNYQKQHLIQFFTDVQMQVPHITSAAFTTADLQTSALTAWATNFGEEFPNALAHGGSADELLVTRAQLATLSRYATDLPADVVAIGLEHTMIAANTDRTPITSSGTTLVRERSSYTKVAKAGDWYLDADVGLLFVWEDGGNASPFAAAETVTYYHYGATASTQWRQVSAVGKLMPGDFVTYDKYSNFIKLDVTASTLPSEILGRVLELQTQPKGLLERVRTAWDGSSFSADAQMPGTATKGYTDLITLSKESVSDQVAIINVKL